MSEQEDGYDFIVVGSGGGAVCAALAARERGLKPLIVEKESKFGGSTALSGGVMWIPNHPLLERKGRKDSYEKARRYFDAAVGPLSLGSSAARRDAYLRTGPEMVAFLEERGMEFHVPECWPDYYDDRDGGDPVGRSLVASLALNT